MSQYTLIWSMFFLPQCIVECLSDITDNLICWNCHLYYHFIYTPNMNSIIPTRINRTELLWVKSLLQSYIGRGSRPSIQWWYVRKRVSEKFCNTMLHIISKFSDNFVESEYPWWTSKIFYWWLTFKMATCHHFEFM